MTTREELVALRDWIRRPDYAEEFSFDDIIDWINERPVATVERLASRQEVSVEELAMSMHSTCASVIVPQGEEIVARSLLTEYSITKRTTEE
jgi:hypothetical protein